MRNRDNLYKKLKRDPKNEILKTTYKRYRNFCNSTLKKAKRKYEKQEIENAKDNKKKLWEVIKNISGQKKPVDYSTNLLQKADQTKSLKEVNLYFSNIGKKLARDLGTESLTRSVNCDSNDSPAPKNSLVLLPTDEDEIFRLIMDLKNKCAVGLDQIGGNIIKRYSNLLTRPITHICNLALTYGEFPSSFKIALIKPIYKSGDRDRVENFRPISILPTLSKILEKLLNKRLTSFLESNSLLSSSQYGFRSNRSTNDAVHELTNTIITNLDAKKKCLVVFLDLAKAFDTVSIPLLLRKLEVSGVRGLPLQLFSNYLSNRKQRVKIDNLISEEQPVTFGVPQGSILGPSLFLVYINGLCNLQIPSGRILTFADDTALMFNGNTWEDVFRHAQEGLTKVCSWLKANMLTLNVTKTNYIAFAFRSNLFPPTNLSITAHNCNTPTISNCTCLTLQRTDNIKYLGVVIDQSLTFKLHINTLATRLRKLIYIFKAIKHAADHSTIKMVYLALCQSILGYCLTSWGGSAKTHLIVLERAQRAILKVSAGLPYRFPTTELYEKWGVLTVRKLFLLQVILTTHSQLTYDPNLVKDKRRKGKINCSQSFRTSTSHNFICFLGPYTYNKVNSILSIYPLCRTKCKKVVTEWLSNLTYQETENFLSPSS